MKSAPSRETTGARRLLAAALLAAMAAVPCRAGGYGSLAGAFSRAAARAGIKTVAVLPFEAADFSEAGAGAVVAERLTTRLVKAGRVRTVERKFLERILAEQRLGRTGAVAPETAGNPGRLEGVEGIVTGSYVVRGRRLRVQARLIEVETGVIVAAAQAEVEAAVPARARSGRPAAAGWLLPAFNSDPPVEFMEESLPDFLSADAAAGAADPATQCAQAGRAVADMEAGILDLKARAVALRVRKGLAAAGEAAGADIPDPELRRRLAEGVAYWSARERIPELTVEETVTYLVVDGKAQALRRKCEGLKGDL
ncbi:MAG: FlgO family outer membrane protein [Elusimicrobia bacterium]|nr:FlgO family outer membrane protein [Elusimicrobiota bacterium]